jgi:hypothetical protein
MVNRYSLVYLKNSALKSESDKITRARVFGMDKIGYGWTVYAYKRLQ